MIIFTRHAKEKFAVLGRHKFLITEKEILKTIERADVIDYLHLLIPAG